MVSFERSKKKVQLWKKAIVHFTLCFVMGFFTGFAPNAKSSLTSTSNRLEIQISPQSFEILNRNLIAQSPEVAVSFKEAESESETEKVPEFESESESDLKKLLIIITPMRNDDEIYGVLLRRLANTVRLIPPPLLWIVVEAQRDSEESDSSLNLNLNVAEMLRKTGIMYRHLVLKKNFTDSEDELNDQRNIALKHIEQHKLAGIVHFAGISNIYDIDFFHELRSIEVFGTWPMAILSAKENKVKIEGPVCDTSNVIGWHLKKMNNETSSDEMPPIHISSFGFNSSILWDPERWGRPSSAQGTSQNSIKFVKEVVLEDETKLKGIPQEDCSKIMLWNLQFPFGSSQN